MTSKVNHVPACPPSQRPNLHYSRYHRFTSNSSSRSLPFTSCLLPVSSCQTKFPSTPSCSLQISKNSKTHKKSKTWPLPSWGAARENPLMGGFLGPGVSLLTATPQGCRYALFYIWRVCRREVRVMLDYIGGLMWTIYHCEVHTI